MTVPTVYEKEGIFYLVTAFEKKSNVMKFADYYRSKNPKILLGRKNRAVCALVGKDGTVQDAAEDRLLAAPESQEVHRVQSKSTGNSGCSYLSEGHQRPVFAVRLAGHFKGRQHLGVQELRHRSQQPRECRHQHRHGLVHPGGKAVATETRLTILRKPATPEREGSPVGRRSRQVSGNPGTRPALWGREAWVAAPLPDAEASPVPMDGGLPLQWGGFTRVIKMSHRTDCPPWSAIELNRVAVPMG